MDGPAEYRIRVKGELDAAWSDRLWGMTITTARQADGTEQATLTGRLPDQAALAGVLNALYELNMPMLSVECLDSLCAEGERG